MRALSLNAQLFVCGYLLSCARTDLPTLSCHHRIFAPWLSAIPARSARSKLSVLERCFFLPIHQHVSSSDAFTFQLVVLKAHLRASGHVVQVRHMGVLVPFLACAGDCFCRLQFIPPPAFLTISVFHNDMGCNFASHVPVEALEKPLARFSPLPNVWLRRKTISPNLLPSQPFIGFRDDRTPSAAAACAADTAAHAGGCARRRAGGR
eukprot:6186644-Pleurochrysis_carterae.AAC.1